MTIRVKKFKFTKTNKVSINYEAYNTKAETWDEYSLTCADDPRPELRQVLSDLNVHVIDMCELPYEYRNRIKVTGVSFSHSGENEVMGAVIVSQMELDNSNCNLNLNTPHKASESYNDGPADSKQLLSDACVEALCDLCKEIELYINGERAQLNLFAVK